MEEERKHFHNNRNRDRGGRHGRRMSHGNRSGRSQRPLLTSSVNAAGLCLVALVFSMGVENIILLSVAGPLGTAVIAFAISALISYFAQRSSKKKLEKTSDIFFFIGILIVIYVAIVLGDFAGMLGM